MGISYFSILWLLQYIMHVFLTRLNLLRCEMFADLRRGRFHRVSAEIKDGITGYLFCLKLCDFLCFIAEIKLIHQFQSEHSCTESKQLRFVVFKLRSQIGRKLGSYQHKQTILIADTHSTPERMLLTSVRTAGCAATKWTKNGINYCKSSPGGACC